MYLHEVIDLFNRLYGRRNPLCFPYGLHELLMLMSQSFSELARALRKDETPDIIRIRLANAVAWLCGVVNHFDELPFVNAFVSKYGQSKCPYCDETLCLCDPDYRLEPKRILIQEIPPGDRGKTLAEWCHHLDLIFGRRNRDEGMYRVIAHLFEEVSELLDLTGVTIIEPNNLDDLEREFALELVDVLAHLIAIANLQGIDLTVAIQERYGDCCPTCQFRPCRCPRLMIVKDIAQRIGSE